MIEYVKYRKSLDSKSKSKKDKKTFASSDQASIPSSRAVVLKLFCLSPPFCSMYRFYDLHP